MPRITIPQSEYYDGRRKIWREGNFEEPFEPSIERVNYWINEWEHTQGYPEQESALNKLFGELCPYNNSLDDILIKACTLNDFYSTNIYKVFDVAAIIQEMEIDERLNSDEIDTNLVDELVENTKRCTGRSIYSFATKYCSHHRPDLYPIYDSYVDILLRYYRDHNNIGFTFSNSELKTYSSFCYIEDDFKDKYGLQGFNAKEIDKFLWQEGKKCFPQWRSQ